MFINREGYAVCFPDGLKLYLHNIYITPTRENVIRHKEARISSSVFSSGILKYSSIYLSHNYLMGLPLKKIAKQLVMLFVVDITSIHIKRVRRAAKILDVR